MVRDGGEWPACMWATLGLQECPLQLLGWMAAVPRFGTGGGGWLLVAGLVGPELVRHLPMTPSKLALRVCWPM